MFHVVWDRGSCFDKKRKEGKGKDSTVVVRDVVALVAQVGSLQGMEKSKINIVPWALVGWLQTKRDETRRDERRVGVVCCCARLGR